MDVETFVEIVVWRLPKPVPGSRHAFTYRLAFLRNEVCVLRYDNEAGKGDHRHVGEKEAAYSFTTPESLLNDFWRDVERWRVRWTVTLQVTALEEVKRRAREAFRGTRQGSRITFASPELLFKLLTPKRWELIRAITGAGPLSIREAARRVNRDVKAVHGDVQALLKAGVLQKTEAGQIMFPYDAVRLDVTLHAA